MHGLISMRLRIRKMDNYFSDFETIAVAVLGTVILAFALFGWRRLFYLAFAALVIVSGFFVNPVVEGTGAIFEKHWQKKSKNRSTRSW